MQLNGDFELCNKISHDGKFINFGVFDEIHFIEITGFQISLGSKDYKMMLELL